MRTWRSGHNICRAWRKGNRTRNVCQDNRTRIVRRFNRGGRNDRGTHKKIRRDNRQKNVNRKKDADTLDREMRDYWAKTGSAKGKS